MTHWYWLTSSCRLNATGEVQDEKYLLWTHNEWDVSDLLAELTRRAHENQAITEPLISALTRIVGDPPATDRDTTPARCIEELLLDPDVRELTREEGTALFDRTARRLLDISGEEFLARYDRGDYSRDRGVDETAVAWLELMMPFVRDVPTFGEQLAAR